MNVPDVFKYLKSSNIEGNSSPYITYVVSFINYEVYRRCAS